MIKLTSLWQSESAKSAKGEYFKGRMGDVYVLLFHNPSNHPKAPAFDLCIAPISTGKDKPRKYTAKPSKEAPEPEFNEDRYTDLPPDEGTGETGEDTEDVPF